MVVIRLARGGAKKKPFYRIMVADRRRASTGRSLEQIGFFNPVAKEGEERLRIDNERAQHWISQGARPSERVARLLKEAAAS
jgi:small subunit ribosomal protein S16